MSRNTAFLVMTPPARAEQTSKRVLVARPKTKTPDYEQIRKSIAARYPKTLAYLAK